jgi:hypothetical protein
LAHPVPEPLADLGVSLRPQCAKLPPGSERFGSFLLDGARLSRHAISCHLNLTYCKDTKVFDAARRILQKSVILNGKLDMKLFGSRLPAHAMTAASLGAALLLSVSAGYAQSGGPFAGFDGNWAGNGTVALSDGTTERLRCKASYKVAGTNLKQSLQCASDSYKFNLSSDVTSQGDRISGNWSESSRNVNGELQGTAGGGQIDVFVQAAGFAASINLRTSGSKQVVQISSKGEIRGVNITMTKT